MNSYYQPIDEAHVLKLALSGMYARHGEVTQRATMFLDTVKKDLREWKIPVKNDHPLVRAIEQMNAVTNDLHRTYQLARDQASRIAGLLRWYNGGSKGEALTKPYFFGVESIPEYVISVDYDMNNEVIQESLGINEPNWRNWEPVRVRCHPFLDLDYYPMGKSQHHNQKRSWIGSGVVIVEVDLALLYTQYRAWVMSGENKHGELELDARFFLSMYVFPNAIKSQMQIAFFNRFCWYSERVPLKKSKFKVRLEMGRDTHPMHYISGAYQWVDECIINSIVVLRKQGSMDFDKYTSMIPRLFDIAYTKHFSRELIIDRAQMADILFASVYPLYQVYTDEVKRNQWQRWNTKPFAALKKGLLQHQQSGHLRNAKPIDWKLYLGDCYQSIWNNVV